MIISFIILLALNIFDAFSTTYLMGFGVEEANPIMNWLMGIFGVASTIIVFKSVFFILLFILCVAYSKKAKAGKATQREGIVIISGFFILISFYSYFMYTANYQLLKLV
jgi:hypothetical protein